MCPVCSSQNVRWPYGSPTFHERPQCGADFGQLLRGLVETDDLHLAHVGEDGEPVDVAADARLDSAMNIRIPTLRSAIHIKGDSLVLMDGETFAEISKMLMFKNKKENVFDSISVNVTVHDGNVTVYPFLVEIDRYKAAVGGEQGLDMNFNYHISILKSPLPFKAGVNISGNLDKMKFRIGKAKYKDAVTPAAVHRVDSTRMNMGNEIVNRFRRVVLGRQPR